MCPCLPCTVRRALSEPRRPFFTRSPNASVLEGSPTTHQSICSPREVSVSITFTVPCLAGPSSSEVMRKPIRPAWSGCWLTNCSQATTMAARLAFISAAPRPTRSSPSTVAVKGSKSQRASSPGGTTSVCPAKTNKGPDVPRVAQKLSTSPKRMGSTEKPTCSRRAIMLSWHPASSGVTERRAISSRVSASVAP